MLGYALFSHSPSTQNMSQKTALYDQHVANHGKMVDFAGWMMPLHYGSQMREHQAVRQQCGMFDVSHMTVIDFNPQTQSLLLRLLANNVSDLAAGHAMYSCMLNEQGGVIDDLIIYQLNGRYRMVVNAATRDKDLAWINKHAQAEQSQIHERQDLSMIAVQGPKARDQVHALLPAEQSEQVKALKRFQACEHHDLFIGRTGYTGEDGYELIAAHDTIVNLWEKLLKAGVASIGLGARDTLRLEAGMHLYGNDMDDSTSPLEAGLAWTIAWEPADRNFFGRKTLELQQQAGVKNKLVGLILDDKGVLRQGQKVYKQQQLQGCITSGTYSPSLKRSIALASVTKSLEDSCQVEVRGKKLNAMVVKPPFVRNGKPCVELP